MFNRFVKEEGDVAAAVLEKVEKEEGEQKY